MLALAFTALLAAGGLAAPATAGASTPPVGNDVSYPQCGTTLPASPAFAIVGLDGGRANDLSPCFGPSSSYPSFRQSELYWATASATGRTAQPKVSLYVNTADPGNVYGGSPVGDWPTSSSAADPYGSCLTTTVTTASGTSTVGQSSPACAWQYGSDKASQDAAWLTSAADAIDSQESSVPVAATAGSYPWWLDVETVNTWQAGVSGQALNVADLQGMIAALHAAGATSVGVYSSASEWDAITGGATSAVSGSLYRIPDWVLGARSLAQAEANCASPSFTAGSVTIAQWFSSPGFSSPDEDYACGTPAPKPVPPGVVDCHGRVVRKPTNYVVTCADANVRWKDVTWSTWSATSAAGHGTLVENTCRPTCVAGRFISYPAEVSLGGVVVTAAHGKVFSRAMVTYRRKGHEQKATFELAT
ncbi:MAG: hypothetical protein ACYDEN_06700 [Acidimicrobiales bacterium]